MAQQISKKFLGDQQVDGSKIKIEQGQSIKAIDNNGQEVELIKISSSTGEITLNGVKPAAASDLSAVESDVSALQSDVSDAQSDISSLQSDVSTAKSDISTLKSDVSTAKSDISTLKSDVSAAQSDISALESDVSVAQSSISSLQSSVGALESDVTTLEGEMATAQSNISSLQSDVSTAKSDISTLKSDVSTLKSDVSTAKSDISALQSDVSAAQLDISSLQSSQFNKDGSIAATGDFNLNSHKIKGVANAANNDELPNLGQVGSLVDSEIQSQVLDIVGEANGIAPLNASGKIDDSFLPTSVLGALKYKGTIDASLGVYPSSPANGDYYVVTVQGAISGHTYHVGDWMAYNGVSWDDIDNSQTVSSVNGKVGAVSLSTSDIEEGSHLYFTDARAVAAVKSTTDAIATDVQDLEAYAQDVRDDLDAEIVRAQAAEALKLSLSGGTMSGVIAMGSNKITGVATPTDNADVATKAYVDTAVSNVSVDLTPYLKKDGSVAMTGALDLGTHKISNVVNPSSAQDAATKAYVDTAVSNVSVDLTPYLKKDGSVVMTGALDLGTHKISNVVDPASNQDAATKKYVDDKHALQLALAGGTMSGAIAMGSNKITGLTDPSVASQDAATAAYVDSMGGLLAGQNANGIKITLTASQKKVSFSSGSTATSVVLPPLADLVVGAQINVINATSAVITLRNSGDTADVGSIQPGHLGVATIANKSGAGSWGFSQNLQRTTSGYNASNAKIIGLAAGTTNGDAVRYEQVLLLAGGTMSGAIAMGSNKITGLTNPTAGSQEAATAKYVDDAIAAIPSGGSFDKEKFTLSSADIANGYITLARLAKSKSIKASVGRLCIHEGASDDYTVSTVGGVSRITFLNSLIYPGVEALVAGDVVFVEYSY